MDSIASLTIVGGNRLFTPMPPIVVFLWFPFEVSEDTIRLGGFCRLKPDGRARPRGIGYFLLLTLKR